MPPEPPSNGGYMAAAYIVAALILIGYWVRLWVKARRLAKGASQPASR